MKGSASSIALGADDSGSASSANSGGGGGGSSSSAYGNPQRFRRKSAGPSVTGFASSLAATPFNVAASASDRLAPAAEDAATADDYAGADESMTVRVRSSSSVAEAGFGEAELDQLLKAPSGAGVRDAYPESERSLLLRLGNRLRLLCGAAVWSCLVYSAFSIGMTLVNKVILTTFEFNFHMALLFYQNATSVVLLQLARRLGLVTFAPLRARELVAWIPLNFLFVGMLLTSFYSLKLLSVPMATIFKNSTNILITAGDYFFYGREVTPGIMGSLGLMLVGAVLAGQSDLEFSATGYAWAFLNCGITAAYVLYMPRAMADSKLNAFGRVYYNNLLSLPLVLAADVVLKNDFITLWRLWRADDGALDGEELRQDAVFTAVVLFSGCIGFLLSLTSFQCVQLTSPTTYAMVGAMNKIPLAGIGIFMFSTSLSMQSLFFILVSLVAGMLYAYSKSQLNSKS